MVERSGDTPPACSGTPRVVSPIPRAAASTSCGAFAAVSAAAAAGRSTSWASSAATSTSICSSSVGVRSKAAGQSAGWARAGASAWCFFSAIVTRPKTRFAAPTVVNPTLVVVKTARSAGSRRCHSSGPRRSSQELPASRFNTRTAYPIGSGRSPSVSPCRCPRGEILLTTMTQT
jgi:hypothetical protein